MKMMMMNHFLKSKYCFTILQLRRKVKVEHSKTKTEHHQKA